MFLKMRSKTTTCGSFPQCQPHFWCFRGIKSGEIQHTNSKFNRQIIVSGREGCWSYTTMFTLFGNVPNRQSGQSVAVWIYLHKYTHYAQGVGLTRTVCPHSSRIIWCKCLRNMITSCIRRTILKSCSNSGNVLQMNEGKESSSRVGTSRAAAIVHITGETFFDART